MLMSILDYDGAKRRRKRRLKRRVYQNKVRLKLVLLQLFRFLM